MFIFTYFVSLVFFLCLPSISRTIDKSKTVDNYEAKKKLKDINYYTDYDHDDRQMMKLSIKLKQNSHVTTEYVKLPLDHFHLFAKKSDEFWYMRVLKNAAFWKPRAPIYLLVGGNEPLKTNVLTAGFIVELAAETGGLMIAAEHRFYAENNTLKDLRYLSSRQAIEDLYQLISRLKKEKIYSNSKVVVIGGGYGGSLAVWQKVIHDDASDIVIASGAPIVAIKNYWFYFAGAANDYVENVSPRCSSRILEITNWYYTCLHNVTNTHDCLESQYTQISVCPSTDFSLKENRQLFFLVEGSFFSDAVAQGLRQMLAICKFIRSGESKKELTMFWNKNSRCYDYDFRNFIKKIRIDKRYSKVKHWFYQCCTEFGFFPTSGLLSKPLDSVLPVDFYSKLCFDLFGSQFDEAAIDEGIKRTNTMYGGWAPNIKDVIYIYGELDPWRFITMTASQSYRNEVVKIKGASHCTDLLPRNSTDSLALKSARNRIKRFVMARL